jgi:hypothetical protein
MRYLMATLWLLMAAVVCPPLKAQAGPPSVGIVQIEDMASTGQADTFSP